MSTLTKPQGRIALGYAVVQGERVLVTIDREWDKFLSDLAERAGGVVGVSTTELVESAYEDAGIQEMQAAIFTSEYAQNQRPIVELMATQEFDSTAELRARIDALETAIQGLTQGLTA